MTTRPGRARRSLLAAATLAGVFAAGGCGSGEGVESYRVPKTAEGTAKTRGTGEYRIIGAMFPADDPVWFFKLTGRSDQLAKHEADFDKLLASVRLQGETTVPAFTPPEGWKLGGPRGGTIRIAQTVQLPDSKLEVTVTQARGDVHENVVRWAKQVGLGLAAADVPAVTRTVDAAGGKGLRVDVSGPTDPTKSAPMMMGKR